MSSTQNLGTIAQKVFEILKALSPDDRGRVVTSAMALFGEAPPSRVGTTGSQNDAKSGIDQEAEGRDAGSYFKAKEPQNKGETLAVAARFLEEKYKDKHAHSKEDLKKVIDEARRNFDSRNFSSDMSNAKVQSGFFRKDSSHDSYQLSYYGQQYVDALPDRKKAKKLRKPSSRLRRSTSRKTRIVRK